MVIKHINHGITEEGEIMKYNMKEQTIFVHPTIIKKAELNSFEFLGSGLSSFMNAEKYPTAYLGIDKL